MADQWHKQVAVRFPPADLAALDRLVEKAKNAEGRSWWVQVTRSQVVLELVRAADTKLKATQVATAARKVTRAAKKKKRGAR